MPPLVPWHSQQPINNIPGNFPSVDAADAPGNPLGTKRARLSAKFSLVRFSSVSSIGSWLGGPDLNIPCHAGFWQCSFQGICLERCFFPQSFHTWRSHSVPHHLLHHHHFHAAAIPLMFGPCCQFRFVLTPLAFLRGVQSSDKKEQSFWIDHAQSSL